MYTVKMKNYVDLWADLEPDVIEIHGTKEKLVNGKIIQGINVIDTFTFAMMPNNAGFEGIHEFSTLAGVYDVNKNRYEFVGRALYVEDVMEEDGSINKTVTCESVFGFLCDSVQRYVEPKNWAIEELFIYLIDCHNSGVEEYKRFKVGEITAVTFLDTHIYTDIPVGNTWDVIMATLVAKNGGELQYRVEEDGLYIDYLKEIGVQTNTNIRLSQNMKAMTREINPTDFTTRLIPLGCKLKKIDEESGDEYETDERLTIVLADENKSGFDYIDNELGMAFYGIHTKAVVFDDVTDANTLYSKGTELLYKGRETKKKYTVTVLDLSLLGIADDFMVGDRCYFINSLLNVDDIIRIKKKTIDICNIMATTIEIGDRYNALSDIQQEQSNQLISTTEMVAGLQKSKESTKIQLDALEDRVTNLEQLILAMLDG